MKRWTAKRRQALVLVTGATAGIGEAVATALAAAGHEVIVHGRSEARCALAVEAIQARGGTARAELAEFSSLAQVRAMAERLVPQNIDVVVNNAGVSAASTVLESSLNDWNWIMGVNFYGMLYGVRAFVPRMIEQDTVGYVVNIASMAGVVEAVDAYHVSKQAAVALTESLYHDLADSAPQIKVSVFLPGLVNTKLYRAEESRPTRFKKNKLTSNASDEHKDMEDFFGKYGFPIEEAVCVLFAGIAQEKLYIGPREFQKQSPQILDVIQKRAENIVKERNPEHPRDLGPTNPA